MPPTQIVLGEHATPTHVGSTQSWDVGSHAVPVWHGLQPQPGTQMPLEQNVPCAHSTPEHGSTHAPTRHTDGNGQVIPSHGALHTPAMQTVP